MRFPMRSSSKAECSGFLRSSPRRSWPALAALVVLAACGSSEPKVGHQPTGLKHAMNADTAYRLGRYGVAAARYRQSLVHLRAADDQEGIARTLHNYGMSLKAAGDCQLAVRNLQESAQLHRKLGKAQELALNLLAVGECQHALGMTEDALTTLGQARTWAKKAGDSALGSRAVAGIGATLASAGRTEQARAKYQEAMKLAKSSDDPGAAALVQNNLGRLHARSGEHATAAALFLKAADGFRKARDGDGLASALANAASSMQSQGGDALEVATLFQRSAYAAVAVRQLPRAAASFAAAAKLYAAAGKSGLAEECKANGRRVLEALERARAAAKTAQQ